MLVTISHGVAARRTLGLIESKNMTIDGAGG